MLALALWSLILAAPDGAPSLPDPLQAGWRGQPVCERLHEEDRLRVLRCRFAPGQGHERHFHAAHFGYVLTGGRMRIRDARGVRDVDLASGSTFHSEGIEWHEVLNLDERETVFLIVEPKPSRPGGEPARGNFFAPP